MPASFEQLDSELNRRFTDYLSLERWVKFELDRDLREIVPETGLQDVRFKLMQWAVADGFWHALEAKLWASGSAPVIKELVDRALQWRKFDEAYHNGLRDNPGKPQIYVLPCTDADAPHAFVVRVRHFLVNQLAGSAKTAIPIPRIITPNDVGTLEEIAADYKSTLFQVLGVALETARERSAAELLASHLRLNHHVVLEMCVSVDDFGPGLTTDFLEWLAEYWDVCAEPKCLIFIHLQSENPGEASWRKRLEFPPRPLLRVLPPLEPVKAFHVKFWLQQYPEIDDPEQEAEKILKAGTRMRDILRSIGQWDIERKRRTNAA